MHPVKERKTETWVMFPQEEEIIAELLIILENVANWLCFYNNEVKARLALLRISHILPNPTEKATLRQQGVSGTELAWARMKSFIQSDLIRSATRGR